MGKRFLLFLSKNKRYTFHFHVKTEELYWTMYSPFCSTTFCHFSGNFIIPSSQNFLSFWAKNCSRCLLQSSRKLNFFFSLTEFCKDLNKWKPQGAMSSENNGWIRTYSLSLTVFAQLSKKHVIFHYRDGRLFIFCWLILDAFCGVLP